MASTMKSPAQRFTAVLEKDRNSLGWTVARVPFDPAEVWPTRAGLRVCGRINDVGFRTALFPQTGSGFFLLVNRAMQKASGARLGDAAEFSLEPDLEPRPAELPEMLELLLDDEPGLREWYDHLSEYTRREIGKWITAVKGEGARTRRAEQMAERLLATMEAEAELPPLVKRAFRGRPKAQRGWEQMPPAHRRTELMALFSYRTPESQAKRLEALVSKAEQRATSPGRSG